MKTCRKGLHTYAEEITDGCPNCKRLSSKKHRQTAKYKERHRKSMAVIRYRNSEKFREWKKRRKLIERDRHFKKSYGISLNDYLKIKDEQNHSCKICLAHESTLKKALCVDHCHQTGVVRGLLCNSCNIGLGKFRDQIANLESAANYLRGSRHAG